MKIMTKIFKTFAVVSLIFATVISCDNEDYLIFTAVNEKEVKFQNEFLPVYKLSTATGTNVAERLVWNEPDFGAPSTITYVVEVSTSSSFGNIVMNSGDLSANHLALRVKDLVAIAESLGLDEDASTTNSDGSPNNAATLYVRVSAYAGTTSTGANPSTTTSEAATMNIEMLEISGACAEASLSTWGLVGSAVNGWGGENQGFSTGNDVPFISAGVDGLYKAAVTFKDGQWKIRKDNAWAENLGDDGGKLVANGPNIGATAGQYIVTFNEAEMTYKVEANQNVWGIVGSGVHNGWGGPNVKMLPDPCNDGVFLAFDVTAVDGEIKFRKDDAWAENLGDNGADGTTEPNGANIAISAGTYDMVLDVTNGTYKLTKK